MLASTNLVGGGREGRRTPATFLQGLLSHSFAVGHHSPSSTGLDGGLGELNGAEFHLVSPTEDEFHDLSVCQASYTLQTRKNLC